MQCVTQNMPKPPVKNQFLHINKHIWPNSYRFSSSAGKLHLRKCHNAVLINVRLDLMFLGLCCPLLNTIRFSLFSLHLFRNLCIMMLKHCKFNVLPSKKSLEYNIVVNVLSAILTKIKLLHLLHLYNIKIFSFIQFVC